MAPVDPRHFFIMLWSATQLYAEFGLQAARPDPMTAVTLARNAD